MTLDSIDLHTSSVAETEINHWFKIQFGRFVRRKGNSESNSPQLCQCCKEDWLRRKDENSYQYFCLR